MDLLVAPPPPPTPSAGPPATSSAGTKRALDPAPSTASAVGARRGKRARTAPALDIAVSDGDDGHSSDAFADSDSNEDDELDLDLSSHDSPYVDVIDPSLKPHHSSTFPSAGGRPKSKKPRRSAVLAAVAPTPTSAEFLSNTGPFLAPDPGAAGLEYTHISQALAQQPNAVNQSLQTSNMLRKLGEAEAGEGGLETRFATFITEVKAQMFGLSERLDALETSKHSTTSSLAALRATLASLEAHLPSSSGGANPVSDAANAQSAITMNSVIRSQISDLSEHLSGVSGSGEGGDQLGPADFLNNAVFQSIVAGAANAAAAAGPSDGGRDVVVDDDDAPRAKRGKKGKRRDSSAAPGGGDAKPAKGRARKPELSRAVRSTMFRLLGVSLAGSGAPISSSTGAPMTTVTSKYHGYTSQPELPDFTPTVAFDAATGARLWRWEWDKTIRQSSYNTAFASAIQNQVLSDRDAQGMHRDVPAGDWGGLEDAVEAAYTNLRREREAQVDPAKKRKKDEHRRRGKKRGLKEDKCKRRLRAFREGGVATLPNGTKTEPAVGWINMVTSFGPDESLESALDLRYMSSEDELEPGDNTHEGAEELGGPTTTLVAGDKTFLVSRPGWRSSKLARALGELDALKPPERAYRRLLGPPRREPPPEGTPEWMISETWRQQQALGGVAQAALDLGKGKGKEGDIAL